MPVTEYTHNSLNVDYMKRKPDSCGRMSLDVFEKFILPTVTADLFFSLNNQNRHQEMKIYCLLFVPARLKKLGDRR